MIITYQNSVAVRNIFSMNHFFFPTGAVIQDWYRRPNMFSLYITSICVIRSARILFAHDDSSSFDSYFHARLQVLFSGFQFLIIICRYVSFSRYRISHVHEIYTCHEKRTYNNYLHVTTVVNVLFSLNHVLLSGFLFLIIIRRYVFSRYTMYHVHSIHTCH